MSMISKIAMLGAGGAGGAGPDIDEVFSPYLYTGTGAAQTITNGIDLLGEGGLAWIKSRTGAVDHNLMDTARGLVSEGGGPLTTTSTSGQGNNAQTITSFNSNGFTVGTEGSVSTNAMDFASWTFRKAPKFFDVVTYTGNGTSGRSISHSLGSVPGMILFKRTDSTSNWIVWHRSTNKYLFLDATDAGTTGTISSPTGSVFTIGSIINPGWNASGGSYVAYLFAHNDSGDGEFGPDGGQDIIKCGSYTGNGSTTGPEIDLGFEPQWVLVKNATATGSWLLVDAMRGMTVDGTLDPILYANLINSEDTSGRFTPLPTGFKVRSTSSFVNTSGQTYIYMAIRRGSLAVPGDATEVFEVATRTAGLPSFEAPFAVDMGLVRKGITTAGGVYNAARLTGTKFLYTNGTDVEATDNGFVWDFMDGWANDGGTSSEVISWMWKRAPGFFDVTAWDVDGTGYQYVNHNLGVVPEMIWTKNRDSTSPTYNYWVVGHKDLTGWDSPDENDRHILKLNTTAASAQQGYHREFTDTSVRLLGAAVGGYTTTDSVIGYLFASAPGVSKVGSYTGNGSSQTIDCGFTAGARFILIKRTDAVGDWYTWDTARGIIAGDDPHLSLNTTVAEVTTNDSIDPDNSGFIVNELAATNINVSAATYIFYAVA